MVCCGSILLVICGVDFNVEIDGFFFVAYRVVVGGLDLNMEVVGLFVVHMGWWSMG